MTGLDIRDLIGVASQEAGSGTATATLPGGSRGFARLGRRSALSPVVVTGVARLGDALLVAVSGIAVHAAYLQLPIRWTDAAALVAITAFASVAFQSVGAYSVGALRSFVSTGYRVAAAWTGVFVGALACVFFLKAGLHLSRVWLGGWYLGGLAALLLARFFGAIAVNGAAREGRFDRRTAIVGGGEPLNQVIGALEGADNGIRIVGVYDDRDDKRSPPIGGGHRKLGTVSDLVEHARRDPLDLVIFTLPITAEDRLLEMLSKLWVLPVDIRLSAHASKLKLRPRAYSYIGSMPVLDLFDKPIADWDLVLKALFDRVVGSLALVLLSPVLLAAAIAIKLDSRGPVLFRQKRFGFNNELIEVLKFRSMYVDQADAGATKLVTRDDPRVTRVGHFLRKSSIDELPQLFSVVFRGDLSLVGPRPHALQAKAANRLYDQVVDGYFARHKVKPGITGWAQINGWRGETDTQEKIQRRVEHDLYYIENWSVSFDLYILATTPLALLRSENAF